MFISRRMTPIFRGNFKRSMLVEIEKEREKESNGNKLKQKV